MGKLCRKRAGLLVATSRWWGLVSREVYVKVFQQG